MKIRQILFLIPIIFIQLIYSQESVVLKQQNKSVFSYLKLEKINTYANKETIILSNKIFTKKIHVNIKEAAPIRVEYYDVNSKLLAKTNKELPYFEFCLNGDIISSNEQIWIKSMINERKMQNGGIEYSLIFRGTKRSIDGLEVTLIQQIFPNSTLMREKLILKAVENQAFELNKYKEKLHFKFPQYSIVSDDTLAVSATEFRLASWELKPITFDHDPVHKTGYSAKSNHMFYPNLLSHRLSKNHLVSLKGPISIVSNSKQSWLTAYEHASQDNLNGIIRDTEKQQDEIKVNDMLQGTKGVFNFPMRTDDFKFIDIQYISKGIHTNVSVNLRRGAYLDGEIINAQHPYSTVWSATAFYAGNSIEKGKEVIQQYLFKHICEKPASRKPEFYYNTWGMQREASRKNIKNLRGILTYDRIFKEIEYASELGVDIFVLDDGWEQMQGVWTPHKKRLPQGLAPIKQKLDERGIKMGLWLSPAGIDSRAQRYKENPEWIILDSENNPIQAQWDHPAFDIVSDFFDIFVDDCKKLIDDGALFFKWDAINTFYSSLPNLHHGSDKYPKKELRARYAYMLPLYITKAMEILTDYEPELVIEIDVTEARRVMMGLAPLSHGKLFFMNNGASWYNDYSSYRTMSMRTIPNEYAGMIPLELFTYANYPHDIAQCMHYNVNTSLISGHGFWGNLELMSRAQRLDVGNKVKKSKRILPFITQIDTEIQGNVGDSLETYSQVNHAESAGQVILFNQYPYSVKQNIKVNMNKFLGVLNQPYHINSDTLCIHFHDNKKPSTQEAFIIPNNGIQTYIQSSSCTLDNINLNKKQLEYKTNGPGHQIIIWNDKYGTPEITASQNIKHTIKRQEMQTRIEISTESKTYVKIVALEN